VKSLRRLAAYFRPYVRHLAFSGACMAVVGASAGAAAWLVKPVLDEVFIRQDAAKLKLLPLAVLALYLLKGVCRYLQAYTMRWVGEAVVLKLRADLLACLQGRELGFFDRNPTGALVSRVTHDVGAMHRAIPDVIQLARQAFTLAGLAFVLLYRDWRLALVAVAVFPLAAYPARRVAVLLRRYARRGQERTGQMANALQEGFSGIAVVKAFGLEERQAERFRAEAESLRRVNLKTSRVSDASAPFMEFLGALGAAAIIWYGGSQVLAGKTTPGSFFSFLTALFMLYDPLKRAGSLNASLQQALAAAERVFQVMDAPAAPSERGGVLPVPRPVEEVRFEGVRFAYDGSAPEVLRGVSFRALRGQVVALVGPSGSGKSTALKLLPRFYDPAEGSIRINGTDIREYRTADLREAVAVVTQDTFLFDDTIRNNIRAGRPTATEPEVEEAARAAYADGFIRELADGYDTRVGERGDLLSGGQKQRIAIARALLKDAPILILDEATSSLDSVSEGEVHAALERLMRSRTTFVIAHRLSTVRSAGLILFLRHGEIVARGTHAELMEGNEDYRHLCRVQFGGEAADG